MKFYYIKGETLDDVEEMDRWRDSQLPSFILMIFMVLIQLN